MIEYRAMLRKDRKFEGGFKLFAGTIIYARETTHGWLGTYYEDKGTGHGFALNEDDFSIFQAGDCLVNELVVIPDPPTPTAEIEKERELARRRLENKAKRHREAADEIEQLLSTQP
jgi:hypothetical protein